MAARSNLALTDALKSEFLSAQESRRIRFIKARILDESITLHSTVEKVAEVGQDFDNILAPSLLDTEAIFVLFCTTDDNFSALGTYLGVSLAESANDDFYN